MSSVVKKIIFMIFLIHILSVFAQSNNIPIEKMQNTKVVTDDTADYEKLLPCLNSNSFPSCLTNIEKKVLKKYSSIAKRNKKALCVKTTLKDICFYNNGAGDNARDYRFIGLLTQDIAIVFLQGYEESFYYFISLKTSNIVLVLPPIIGAESQISLSPDKKSLLVITTNNGYAADSSLTQIDIFELVEKQSISETGCEDSGYLEYLDAKCNEFPKKITLNIKEKEEGVKKYQITWLGSTSVKIQALSLSKDYISFNKKNNNWVIKDKKFVHWKIADLNSITGSAVPIYDMNAKCVYYCDIENSKEN